MGFKWFKARLRMNRMPLHSSAIPGSYKITTFDGPNFEIQSNDNQRDNGNIQSEPKLSVRQQSMPSLNGPMIEVANGDDDLTFFPMNNDVKAHSLSTRTLDSTEISAADMYNGLGAGDPAILQKGIFKLDVAENIVKGTPRPVQKTQKGDFKKKKVKAPAPKINLNKSSASTSENNSLQFLNLQDKRKVSQDSDVDV